MKIGIAGPMSLELLNYDFEGQTTVPAGYSHPPISMLINSLVRRGHNVVAYTTSTGISDPVVYAGGGLTICVARRRKRHAARDLFKYERKDLLELMLRYPSDIINAQWSYEFAWAALDSGIPTVVSLRDYAPLILKYQFDGYRLMRLIMNHIALKKAKYLTANSQYLYNCLSERDKKKTRVIPNFYGKHLEDHFNKRNPESKYILSISNGFGKLKNISTALRAFSLIRETMSDLDYHLVGDGMEAGGPAHEYSEKNRLGKGVRFIGKQPYEGTIHKVKQALVLLHPSREESFGMSVLEAMAVGTPVVGGCRSGNIPYLLEDGNAGVLCDINSADDIARAVLQILSDISYARSRSEKARKFAKENFSEEVVVPRYIDYYRDIAKKC